MMNDLIYSGFDYFYLPLINPVRQKYKRQKAEEKTSCPTLICSKK